MSACAGDLPAEHPLAVLVGAHARGTGSPRAARAPAGRSDRPAPRPSARRGYRRTVGRRIDARSAEEDGGGVEEAPVDGLQLARRRLRAGPGHVGAAQRDHHAEVALVHGVDRLDPEAGRDHAVVRGRACRRAAGGRAASSAPRSRCAARSRSAAGCRSRRGARGRTRRPRRSAAPSCPPPASRPRRPRRSRSSRRARGGA